MSLKQKVKWVVIIIGFYDLHHTSFSLSFPSNKYRNPKKEINNFPIRQRISLTDCLKFQEFSDDVSLVYENFGLKVVQTSLLSHGLFTKF